MTDLPLSFTPEVREALTVHVVGDVLDVVRGALTPVEGAAAESGETASAA